MTRDEGLLISLEKEPHNWEAILDATHITPNGDRYLQFKHKPTKTILNAILSDEEDVKISLTNINTNNRNVVLNADVINTSPETQAKIVRLLMYVKEIAELETATETSFPFLSHVERLG